jgi:uncharacterized protein (DUF427 family)
MSAVRESTTARGRVRVEQSRKRVRACLGGRLVADSTAPLLVWERPYYPTYYIPTADVRAELKPAGLTERTSGLGTAELLDVSVDGQTVEKAARRYAESPVTELRDAIRLEFRAMDEWLEEDEPIYVHPRDPYTRIDVLASSRQVRVEVDGVTLAESTSPRILFETNLPPRYYLPLSDVRMALLTPSRTETQCPYKGTATYWSVEVNGRSCPDFVWIYRTPIAESQKIAGLACFYNERVDLYVDGVRQDRPRTQFS